MYKCPVCNEQLNKNNNIFQCINNHNYDIAKEGYVNLLLANQKSKNPGDNKEMVISRRKFLEKGFYQSFVNKIKDIISSNFSDNSKMLDLGCGEGYYDSQIYHNNLNNNFFSLDISKIAVSLASRKNNNINYAIGSSYNLPYLTNSFDLIFCIFSPYDVQEVLRVLKLNGFFVLCGPGKNHLREIAELIYKEVEIHKGNKNLLESDINLNFIKTENITF